MEGEVSRKGRGRGRGRARGRSNSTSSRTTRSSVQQTVAKGVRVSKRNKIESDDDSEEKQNKPVSPLPPTEERDDIPSKPQFDQDCDISALEAPTFTTLDRGPPAPMLSLSWDHPVQLIGEKVMSPRIHLCDICDKPILLYGRLIPCKHVFCLTCARARTEVNDICPRCEDPVTRVEQSSLGTVYMCTSFSNKAVECKRTYLSQRDLQAHIDHRHRKSSSAREDTQAPVERLSIRDPRGPHSVPVSSPLPCPTTSITPNPSHIPVMTSSRGATNLITVQLQEKESVVPKHPPPQTFPPTSIPPPHNHMPPIITPATFHSPPPNVLSPIIPTQPPPVYPPLSSASSFHHNNPPPQTFAFSTSNPPPNHPSFQPPPNIPPPNRQLPPPQNFNRPPISYDWGAPPPSNFYR